MSYVLPPPDFLRLTFHCPTCFRPFLIQVTFALPSARPIPAAIPQRNPTVYPQANSTSLSPLNEVALSFSPRCMGHISPTGRCPHAANMNLLYKGFCSLHQIQGEQINNLSLKRKQSGSTVFSELKGDHGAKECGRIKEVSSHNTPMPEAEMLSPPTRLPHRASPVVPPQAPLFSPMVSSAHFEGGSTQRAHDIPRAAYPMLDGIQEYTIQENSILAGAEGLNEGVENEKGVEEGDQPRARKRQRRNE